MSAPGWVTNDAKAAAVLRAADSAYARAVAKAANLQLAEKVIALRCARQIREAAYEVAGKL